MHGIIHFKWCNVKNKTFFFKWITLKQVKYIWNLICVKNETENQHCDLIQLSTHSFTFNISWLIQPYAFFRYIYPACTFLSFTDIHSKSHPMNWTTLPFIHTHTVLFAKSGKSSANRVANSVWVIAFPKLGTTSPAYSINISSCSASPSSSLPASSAISWHIVWKKKGYLFT